MMARELGYRIDVVQCQSCGELIRWEYTRRGRPMPITLKTGKTHFIDCAHSREWSRAEPTRAERKVDAGQLRLL